MKGKNRTGSDASRRHRALVKKGKRPIDRERNMRHPRAEEHSRGPRRRRFF